MAVSLDGMGSFRGVIGELESLKKSSEGSSYSVLMKNKWTSKWDISLPKPLWIEIFKYLHPYEIISSARISKTMECLQKDDSFWFLMNREKFTSSFEKARAKIHPLSIDSRAFFMEKFAFAEGKEKIVHQILKKKDHELDLDGVAVFNKRYVLLPIENDLWVWDALELKKLHVLSGHSRSIRVVNTLNEHCIITGSWDETLCVWDVLAKKQLHVLRGHTDWVDGIAVLNEHRVVSTSPDKTLRVWDALKGKELHVLSGRTDKYGSPLIAALNEHCIVSGGTITLHIWDVVEGKELQVLRGHTDEVTALTVLNEHCIVSASKDKTLRVWDTLAGKELSVLGHTSNILTVIKLNERCVISSSDDQALHKWDVLEGKELRVVPSKGKVNNIIRLNEICFISKSNKTLLIWDAIDMKELRILSHDDYVITFNALNERCIISTTCDNTMHVWSVVKAKKK